jgi:hypothetical protein
MVNDMEVSELLNNHIKHQAEMDTFFIYDVTFDILQLNVAGRFTYEIPLESISDESKLVGWTHQLSQKTWMTRDLIGEFIRRVIYIKGWNHIFNI